MILVRTVFSAWSKCVAKSVGVKCKAVQTAANKYKEHVKVIRSLVRSLSTDGVEKYEDAVNVIRAAKSAGVTFKSFAQYSHVSPDIISDLHHGNLALPKFISGAGKVVEGLNKESIESLLAAESDDSGSDDSLRLV